MGDVITLLMSIKVIIFALLTGCAVFPELFRSIKSALLLVVLGFFYFSLFVLAVHSFSLDKKYFLIAVYSSILIGAVRLFIEHKNKQLIAFSFSDTRKTQLSAIVFIAFICLPVLVYMMTSAFDVNDEIYSWNLWARQFYFGESPSFVFTQAVYPQGFSSLLTGFYLILGSLEYQSAAKLSLVILMVATFCLIVFSQKNIYKHCFVAYFLVVLYLYQIGFDKQFQLALADPLMSAYLVAGVYSVLSLTRSEYLSTSKALIIASMFFSAAALTKQTALPWALFFGPLLIFQIIKEQNLNSKNIVIAFIPAIVAVLWLSTSGLGFYENEGVINASFQNRDVMNQIQFSLNKYFVEQPILLLVLLGFSWAILRAKTAVLLSAYAGCITSLFLWLIFGAYDFRLGMHVYLILFMLFLHTPSYDFSSRQSQLFLSNRKVHYYLLVALLIGLLMQSVKLYQRNQLIYVDTPVDLGFDMQSTKLMGKEATEQIKAIVGDNKHKIMTTTNYHYGALYGRANLVNPIILETEIKQLSLRELAKQNISHLFLTSESFSFGGLNSKLNSLIASCPQAFHALSRSNNYTNFHAYAFDESQRCEAQQ